MQDGIDTATFRQNPVILWEHGKSTQRGSLPIANATEYGVDRHKGSNTLIGTARFWDDEFSDARFEDYAAARLKGWSISSLPIDASPPTPAEKRAGWQDCDIVYRSVLLLEVSATSLPGNQSTLTLSVERSATQTLTADPEMERELAALSDEQLVALIERLKLESAAHYFQDRRDGQQKRRDHLDRYEAFAKQVQNERRMRSMAGMTPTQRHRAMAERSFEDALRHRAIRDQAVKDDLRRRGF